MTMDINIFDSILALIILVVFMTKCFSLRNFIRFRLEDVLMKLLFG